MADLHIFDDFYSDVDEVRQMALNMDFSVEGNYPGYRTAPVENEDVKNAIGNLIRPFAGEIVDWNKTKYNSAFQYTTAEDRSWVHADKYNTWAGVLYLTPNAPLSGGTGIFRHKATGLMKVPYLENGEMDLETLNKMEDEGIDPTKWEIVDRIGNVYNRLVLYKGDFFHTSLDYFGTDRYDGRLFQTFFFSSEY